MTDYRAIIERRVRLWTVSISLLTLMTVLHFVEIFRPFASSHYFGFLSGVVAGTTVFIMVFALKKILKYKKALNDERELMIIYNKEHDERTKHIQNKSGGMILVGCAYIIFGTSLIAGFFNTVVFITLLAVYYFLIIVKVCLKYYYTNKY